MGSRSYTYRWSILLIMVNSSHIRLRWIGLGINKYKGGQSKQDIRGRSSNTRIKTQSRDELEKQQD